MKTIQDIYFTVRGLKSNIDTITLSVIIDTIHDLKSYMREYENELLENVLLIDWL